ncbi:MAG: TonB-dependent receptor [Reichenbachiella sp.]
MRVILICILTLISSIVVAQQEEMVFSGTYNNRAVEQVVLDIESATAMRFYYQESWLDSLTFNGQFEAQQIDEVVTQLFEGSNINFIIQGKAVVLTYNSLIVEEPGIAQSLNTVQPETNNAELGLVFSREYQNKSADQSDFKNYVFDIGKRSEMKIGEKSTLVGYVKNSENSEPIIGALVYVKEPFKAASTDYDGFYSITLPNGKQNLIVQYAGMKPTTRKIVLFSDGSLNVDLDVDVIALAEVVIESDKDVNVRDVKIGVTKIDIEETKTVPLVLGEKDILKIATTTAGVQTAGEGASGFNVRGGKTDQNLILLNGAPVYNPSHFFGFFSAFNADAIKSMEVYKGSIPAKYGGRLSSVFAIDGKKGSSKKFSGSGGISPVTSRVTLEIPIVKDTTSIIIAGRSTYSDWILKQIDNVNFSNNEVSFYDLMARVDHKFDAKSEIYGSGYYSNDKFRISSDTLFSFSNYEYENYNGTIGYKRLLSNQLEANVSAVYSHYGYEIFYDESAPNAFKQDFDLDEISGKIDFSYFLSDENQINFGLSSKHYTINPGQKLPYGDSSIVAPVIVQEERGLESALYFSGQFEVNSKLMLYGGIRYSMFNALGPKEVYDYADGAPKNNDTRTDTLSFAKNEIIKTYAGPEIRLSGRYSLDGYSSVKVSYNRTRQYIHMLSNSTSLSPTDIWRVSGMHMKPQIGDQLSLGYYRNLLSNKLEFSVEGYYKRLQNLVDFKIGGSFVLNTAAETEILQGDGKSYGVELSLKKSGRLNGWVNYTYARTLMKLDGDNTEESINQGDFYPTNYDKPHTFNLVVNYKMTNRLSVSSNVTFNTGRPTTHPVAVFNFAGEQNLHYSDRNAYRIPNYFRVDLGFNLEGNHKISKLAHSFWTLSIYNLLGRDNPYSVFFEADQGEIKGYQLVIFGSAIPTLTYNFKF